MSRYALALSAHMAGALLLFITLNALATGWK